MSQRLAEVLRSVGSPRLLVVGDLILDRYVWGAAERVSPEAPVPVIRTTSEQLRLGGMGSVCSDLIRLGAEATACAVTGTDTEGRLCRDLLKDLGVDAAGVLQAPGRRTTVKTRYLAQAQQVLRVDQEQTHPLPPDLEAEILAAARSAIGSCGAVIIQDYAKGLVSEKLAREIIAAAREAGVPVVVDPATRKDLSAYRQATVITPNRKEAGLATGLELDSADVVVQAAQRLLQDLSLQAVVITLDRDGMALFKADGSSLDVPTRARAVYDVTGAGDIVASVIGLVLASGGSIEDAVHLANVAAAIEVTKVGATPIGRNEILAELGAQAVAARGKLLARSDVDSVLGPLRAHGKRIVFTNGCFDCLHIGHLKLIHTAYSHGDVLVLGLNSDASVKKNKGPSRPIYSQDERAELLAALSDVDFIVIFEEESVLPTVKVVKPDVLVKGGDYDKEGVVGWEFVESYGGEVVRVPPVQGVSTTDIVSRITDPKDA